MRPGDDMRSSVVQQVARQALATFRCVEEAGRGFPEQQSKLRALLNEVRAADLRLVEPRAGAPQPPYPGGPPPVTYMHICETDEFSMGVFLLKRGASIPLHDHPGMNGMLKVMYGKTRITCFDRLDLSPLSGTPTGPSGSLRRSVLRSTGEYTEHSGPCVLAPHRDNLHRIDAVDGPTAFLDILAPPYDPDDGRDCHYYKVVPGEAGAPQGSEVWLMDISQPHDFWCGSEPYPGPGVGL
ncbi:2-aminoethanethiol (cysteamine) dioxygenase b [Gadus chalcogrammus]|uniref:2-aminoethanethiol (cysteamine) dioxygenase b n=1 Tax=Gadus chalcogrammus TaxID=1042646 RepID=UPI0024C4C5A1|nr:2-aminoethanethiol (cysteamine) dioxygenase b [Gadus chalcogrammus]